jgi:hypothetical protein
MTRELLKVANNLSHAITDLEAQITIVEEMHHSDNSIQLRCDSIGSITIPGVELKDDIIDMVLCRLNNAKEDLEDELRLL